MWGQLFNRYIHTTFPFHFHAVNVRVLRCDFSGVETISHMRQPGNGRITILFNAFEGAPRILRLWGKGMRVVSLPQLPFLLIPHAAGTVYEFGTPEYDAYIPASNRKAGSRAVVVIDVHKVGTVRPSKSFRISQNPRLTLLPSLAASASPCTNLRNTVRRLSGGATNWRALTGVMARRSPRPHTHPSRAS